MNTFDSIPRINLAPLQYDSDAGVSEVARQVRQAYTQVGFAYLFNHGISPTLIENAFNSANAFHALPLEQKIKIKQNKFFRGYMPLSASKFEISTLGKANQPNQSEAFILAHEVPDDHPDFLTGQYLAGPNQWPDGMPDFKPTIMAYYKAMQSLAEKMIRVFAVAFGLSPDGLDDMFRHPTIFMRLQYYPEQPDVIPDEQYGIAPHTDYGFLTLLAQDNMGGLQVKNIADQWVDVPPVAGTFILNTGDMVKWMTHGHFLSTPHRVINRSGKKRYSIPFFFEPDMHARVSPLPQFQVNHDSVPIPCIEYADHLMERIRSNYRTGA